MIEKTTAYKVGQQVFPTIEEAQRYELESLCPARAEPASYTSAEVATMILENADKVTDILTMRPSSKPKARRINGGTKSRKKTETPAVE